MTSSTLPPAGDRLRRPDAIAVAALVLVTAALYVRTAGYAFVDFDDQGYLYQNPHVAAGLSGAGLRWAATAVVLNNYHPLTEIVQLAIASAAGMRPGAFHAVNAALHTANAGLLFLFLRRLTGRYWPAVIATALWAWHPLRVESVAWASELKDVLCGTLSLLTLLAYLRYARGRSPGRYLLVAGLLVLALLAKPMAVTLPAVLLLLDAWPLRDAGRPTGKWWLARVAEKVPLVALGLLDAALTYHLQSARGPTGSVTPYPLSSRAANAVDAVVIYLRQSVWPAGLAAFYPHPAVTGHPWPAALTGAAGLLLVGLTAAAVLLGRRRPYLPIGWLWFIGMLVPVLGVVQVGDQSHADRYTYLPAIGLTMAIVLLVADWAAHSAAGRMAAATVAALAAVGLIAGTVNLVPTWRDSTTLWARADAVVGDNYVARAARSNQALHAGDVPAAERLARDAVAMAPDRAYDGHAALALALDARGAPDEAVAELGRAVRLAPGNPLLRYQAGAILSNQRRDGPARAQFERALQLDPGLTVARRGLAFLSAREGHFADAADQYRRVLAATPADGQTEGDLADVLRLGGDPAAARPHYAAALAAGERDPDWEAELAWLTAADAAATPGQLAPLAATAKDACDRTADRQPFPLYAYSLVLARLGRFDDAVTAATAARDRAAAAGQTAMVAAIDRRLAAYRQGLPTAAATTGPASR